ncbi:hypothetical protein J2Z62_000253 [Mycoplasmoides fastidiosum]|uniref:Preprotein translocase subunit SecE n=1 Tax=Mycoplasmoides fastidiosum TaxID=92758 RepID=A0ABU0LYP9_9BACT|nr:hypothetical protein [Mycoplasmoides fastidiosum]MDQ0513815.1 hypothetical protein [Mycoplasmoides fastidiosum]UUD37768.1 hypothetical protein NPA10_04360 [Mycoplasmoides fastidiosum]
MKNDLENKLSVVDNVNEEKINYKKIYFREKMNSIKKWIHNPHIWEKTISNLKNYSFVIISFLIGVIVVAITIWGIVGVIAAN